MASQDVLLREYAELEKDDFAFICEERYDMDGLGSISPEDISGFVTHLRRPNMYPKRAYAEKIARALISLIASGNGDSTAEVIFDDVEVFRPEDNVLSERLR